MPWSAPLVCQELLGGAGVRLTPVLEPNPALHASRVAGGWEGTVAKPTTRRHGSGHRSNSWVKLRSAAARDRDRRESHGLRRRTHAASRSLAGQRSSWR
jgi:hypothetical protein